MKIDTYVFERSTSGGTGVRLTALPNTGPRLMTDAPHPDENLPDVYVLDNGDVWMGDYLMSREQASTWFHMMAEAIDRAPTSR